MIRRRILLLPLEFDRFSTARRWPYSVGIGMADGLLAQGVDVVTVPILSSWPLGQSPNLWLKHLRAVCEGHRFDQVWMELIYSHYDQDILDFLARVAPIRVGFFVEGREPYAGTTLDPRVSRKILSLLESRLPYITHVLCVDEKDVGELGNRPHLQALFCPASIGSRFISENPPPPQKPIASFIGCRNSRREQLLTHPCLQGLVEWPSETQEDADARIQCFDKVNAFFDALASSRQWGESSPRWESIMRGMEWLHSRCRSHGMLRTARGLKWFGSRSARSRIGPGTLMAHAEALRSLKMASQEAMLSTIQQYLANINLRSNYVGVSPRVFETIAAGRPVISHILPDRPRMNSLFTNGEEILQFDDRCVEELAEHIQMLRSDPDAFARITRQARARLRAFHTTEARVRQILEWIDGGEEPSLC